MRYTEQVANYSAKAGAKRRKDRSHTANTTGLAQHSCDGHANNKKSTQVVPRRNNGPEALVPEIRVSLPKSIAFSNVVVDWRNLRTLCRSTQKTGTPCNTHPTHYTADCIVSRNKHDYADDSGMPGKSSERYRS